MFRHGRRWFTVACVLLLVGVAHTLGNLQPPPTDAAYQRMAAAMRGYRMPLGLEMMPSVHDIFDSLRFTMSLTIFWLALVGLVIAATDGPDGRVVRGATVVYLAGALAVAGLYAAFRIPPPLISFIVVGIAFGLALPGALGARR